MSIADRMIERNCADREGERERGSGEKEIGWIRGARVYAILARRAVAGRVSEITRICA